MVIGLRLTTVCTLAVVYIGASELNGHCMGGLGRPTIPMFVLW